MLIVHIIIGLGRGGAETMLKSLIEADRSLGSQNKHYVISLTDLGHYGEPLKESGVAVYAMGLNSALSLFGVGIRLTSLLRKLKPDVVQTWMVHSDLLGGIAARFAGVRHVIWGVRTTDYRVESRSTQAVRWVCSRLSSLIPSKIVCVAQASLNNSLRYGYDASKLMVIPNGFNVKALRKYLGQGASIRAIAGLDSSTLVIGCLGRYNPAKDYPNFVWASARLAAKYPACRFLMVGRNLDSENMELQKLIKATGFPSRFILLGERSDPAACLDAMDIFVLASRTEGFPMVLGEAMALGVPCLSTDVGDASVLLGDAGELVPARDSEALAAAMERLLLLPLAERKVLGQKGRERVERDFSIETITHRFNNLYLALVKDN